MSDSRTDLTRGAWQGAGRSWAWLLSLSVVVTAAMVALHLPASTLLGPMVAAAALAVWGQKVPATRRAFIAAQAVVGVMMASHLPVTMVHNVSQQWPALLTGTLYTLTVSMGLGWALTRSGMLPGTTAIWGSTPGAATVMTLMSERFGADMRLVAFMQYLRVLCCAIASALVVHHFGGSATPPSMRAADALQLGAALAAFALVATGLVLSQRLRVPGGPLLVSLLLGIAVQLQGSVAFEVPQPVLVVCFALLGWGIGGRFTRDVLRHAGRIFPIVLGSVLTMIGANALGALVLIHGMGVDPLTAFLATSPGGADSVAIISAGSAVDLPFVMTMQVLRFMVVVTVGPLAARTLSRQRR